MSTRAVVFTVALLAALASIVAGLVAGLSGADTLSTIAGGAAFGCLAVAVAAHGWDAPSARPGFPSDHRNRGEDL
jgi:hypothetical protein